MAIQIIGRSNSHFAGVTRIFALELGVEHELLPVFRVTATDSGVFAGNPALKNSDPQAQRYQVQLAIGTIVAKLPADDVFVKIRAGFGGALRWLEVNLDSAPACDAGLPRPQPVRALGWPLPYKSIPVGAFRVALDNPIPEGKQR